MKNLLTALLLVLGLTVPVLAFDSADTSLSDQGNAEAGRVVFQKCRACHNIEGNANPKIGPNLDNIFGRMAGTSQSYPGYSKALRESGIVWSEKELDEWLQNPTNFLPGNKMPFAGLRSAQDRADLLAYLREVSQN